jgi:hypothetical protein
MKRSLLFLFFLCSIFLAHSQTYFEESVILSDTIVKPYGLDAADIDNDGNIDFVTSAYSPDISWYQSTGEKGKYIGYRIDGSAPHGCWYIKLVDIDNDNDIDIIAALKSGNTNDKDSIVMFENLDGKGKFSGIIVVSAEVTNPFSIDIADIDGDGLKDIVWGSFTGHIGWVKNNGNNTFTGKGVFKDYGSGVIRNVTLADFDEDGDLDIYATDDDTRLSDWFRNDGTGNFSEALNITKSVVWAFRGGDVADIDGDGHMDAVGWGYDDNTEQILWNKNDGTGSFSSYKIVTTAYAESSVSSACLEDFDKDGDVDIFAFNDKYKSIVWFKNDGYGTFSAPITIETFSGDLNRPIVAVDLDNDGDIDVLKGFYADAKILFFENKTLEILTQPTDQTACPGTTLEIILKAKDASSYQWQVSTDNGTTFTDLSDDDVYTGTQNDTLKVIFNNTLDGNAYRCILENNAGRLNSDTIVISTDNIAPELTVKNITIQISGEEQVTISPDDVIEQTSDNCNIASKSLSKDTFTSADEGDNNIDVTVTDDSGNFTTLTCIVTVDVATKIENKPTTDNIHIYPNPVGSILNISNGNNAITKIEIVDVSGNRVLSLSESQGINKVNVGNLQRGVYMIKITSEKGLYIYKFIKK